MAETRKPTNEQIAKLLDQILSELSEMKSDQQQLSADLVKLTKSLER